MDEIIEELRALEEEVPVPLDLPEDDDLLEVESQILLPLPKEYREYLLTASDVVLGHLEPATAADSHSHTYLPELCAQAWDLGLPRHLIPICEHQGQSYYAMDSEGLIRLWSQGEFADQEFESIWHWVRDVWLASVIKGR